MVHILTAEEVLEQLKEEHVLQILNENNIPYKMGNKDIKCKAVCHGKDNFKLYYYKSTKTFFCYSECGFMSIFQLLMNINGWDFTKALYYVANIVGISINYKKPKTFEERKKVISDWDFINIYKKKTHKRERHNFKVYDKNVLTAFDNLYPSSWENEGIKLEAMRKFNVCFHTSEFSTIIPHFSFDGDLIGIRSRHHLSFREKEGKYMPTFLEGLMYNHPLGFNLYGAFENKETIMKKKKLLLVESEKGVMQCESFYPNDNFSVALCGTNLTSIQRDIILYDLNVDEIIIGLDKQYQDLDSEEHERYVAKVKKIAEKFVNYIDVYIIYCTDDKLDYKDSPTDKGKEVLESLMKEKIRYYSRED